jgi:hypothetical protein
MRKGSLMNTLPLFNAGFFLVSGKVNLVFCGRSQTLVSFNLDLHPLAWKGNLQEIVEDDL